MMRNNTTMVIHILSLLSRKRSLLHILLIILIISCGKDDTLSSDDSTMTSDDVEMTTDDDGVTPPLIATTLTEPVFDVFGGSEIDTFQNVTATRDGGAIAIGYSQSVDGDIVDNDAQINKIWIVKFSSDGSLQWSKTYGGSDDDRGASIIETQDGGYAFVGYSKSNDGDLTENAGFYDQWVVKLDASGNMEWQKSFGFPGSDQAFSLIQTADGGYFTAGFLDVSASEGAGNDNAGDDTRTRQMINKPLNRGSLHGIGEYWGHKLDGEGNLEWRRYFGGTNFDRAYEVLPADDGGVLIVGASESLDFDISQPNGSYDFWAVRVDPQGELLWEKSMGGSEIDNAYAATKTPDGNYLIAGDTRSSNGDVTNFRGSADVWLVKLGDNGSIIWQKTLGGSNFESARGITAVGDGFVITGASRSADDQVSENNGQTDIWTLLVDEEGTLLDQKVLGGNDIDFGYGISANAQGKIYVVGDTESTSGPLISTKGRTDAVLIQMNLEQ